jgi:hypothetical protein
MKITFESPKEVVVVKELKRTVGEITVTEVVDYPERKSVKAFTLELGVFDLWEGAAYDAIGQWTDTDVINRITEIVNS